MVGSVPWKSYKIKYLLTDRKQTQFAQSAHGQIKKSRQLRSSSNVSGWKETASCLPKYNGSEWVYNPHNPTIKGCDGMS